MDFCANLVSRGLRIHWGCSTRADCLDKELLDEMYKAGCRSIFLGVESLNDNTLRTIRKGIAVEQVIETSRLIKGLGIRLEAAFILGLPGETKENMLSTIENAKKLNADRINMGFLVPYPGTEIRRNMRSLGYRFVEKEEQFYSHGTVVVENDLVSAADLEELWQKARAELPFTEWQVETRMESLV